MMWFSFVETDNYLSPAMQGNIACEICRNDLSPVITALLGERQIVICLYREKKSTYLFLNGD
jgi:hypothetical protein